MKICFAQHFHLSERIGGAEVQSWLLAVEMARRSHEVSYVCESLTGREHTTEKREGVSIYWLPRRPLLEIPNALAYFRVLTRIAPDVVIQRFTSLYTGIAGRYCRSRQIPFVWICTDDQLPHRHAFRRLQSARNRDYQLPWWKGIVLVCIAAIRDMAKNYGIRNATHPCSQNEHQHQSLLDEFGVVSRHFHSGHRVPELHAGKDVPPLILWVGDMSRKRRAELFVALAEASRELPVDFAMICKAYSRTEATRAAALQAYSSTNPRFRWLGALPLEEANAWFERATLYVHTSDPTLEGFPNTFVQSWLRSTPVISFGTDPGKVIVREGIWRVVSDVGAARAAINDFLSSADAAAAGARARSYAATHHSIESVADLTMAMLNSGADNPGLRQA